MRVIYVKLGLITEFFVNLMLGFGGYTMFPKHFKNLGEITLNFDAA